MRNIVSLVEQMHARGVKLPARLTLADQQRLQSGETLTGRKKRARNMPEIMPYPWTTLGRTVTLTLPGWHPDSINRWGRERWTRKKAVAAARAELLAAEPRLLLPVEQRPEELQTYWRPRVQIVIYQDQERYPDPHNHSKALVDALKRLHLIREDNHRVIDLPPEQFPVDPLNPRTEITLIERGAST